MQLLEPLRTQRLGRTLGVLRCVIGVVALFAPRLVLAAWIGKEESKRPTAVVLARALGGRDVALGMAALVPSPSAARKAVGLGALADSIDLAASLVAYEHLPRRLRVGLVLSTGGAALLGAAVAVSRSEG